MFMGVPYAVEGMTQLSEESYACMGSVAPSQRVRHVHCTCTLLLVWSYIERCACGQLLSCQNACTGVCGVEFGTSSGALQPLFDSFVEWMALYCCG